MLAAELGIAKDQPPKEWRVWEKMEQINRGYSQIPRAVKRVMREQLRKEQGWLCGYTGMWLEDGEFHIERIKPQEACKEAGLEEDVAWDNLIAAYPPEARHGQTQPTDYGAARKAATWDQSKFVSPLAAGCEQRFAFNLNGGIAPANPADAAAQWTIQLPGLDNASLAERRLWVCERAFPKNATLSQLRDRLAAADKKDKQGRLAPCCFAQKQHGELLLNKVERLRKARIQAAQAGGQS